MRPACLDCVRKHLAQAIVLIHEVKKGYPEHYWLVIGHMAEAEDEMLAHDEVYANKIRDERVKYMLDNEYKIPIMDLIKGINAQEDVESETEPYKKLT